MSGACCELVCVRDRRQADSRAGEYAVRARRTHRGTGERAGRGRPTHRGVGAEGRRVDEDHRRLETWASRSRGRQARAEREGRANGEGKGSRAARGPRRYEPTSARSRGPRGERAAALYMPGLRRRSGTAAARSGRALRRGCRARPRRCDEVSSRLRLLQGLRQARRLADARRARRECEGGHQDAVDRRRGEERDGAEPRSYPADARFCITAWISVAAASSRSFIGPRA